jgi:hypothetical protein
VLPPVNTELWGFGYIYKAWARQQEWAHNIRPPIRAITVEMGTRRPLCIRVGGIAIPWVARCGRSVPHRRFAGGALRRIATRLRRTDRARAQSDGQVVKGVRGIAISLCDRSGMPVGAMGIAAISERVRASRTPQPVDMLRRGRSVIERQLDA